jgi:hypothetical protein
MTTATSTGRVGALAVPATPIVSAFTIMPRRFAVDEVPPAFFLIELEAPVEVEVAIAIERHGSGGGLVPTGTLYHVAVGGMNIPRFNGRVGGRPLAPGAYRASITAGDDGFPPRQVEFRIVP